jgi:hypothetical protein
MISFDDVQVPLDEHSSVNYSDIIAPGPGFDVCLLLSTPSSGAFDCFPACLPPRVRQSSLLFLTLVLLAPPLAAA